MALYNNGIDVSRSMVIQILISFLNDILIIVYPSSASVGAPFAEHEVFIISALLYLDNRLCVGHAHRARLLVEMPSA